MFTDKTDTQRLTDESRPPPPYAASIPPVAAAPPPRVFGKPKATSLRSTSAPDGQDIMEKIFGLVVQYKTHLQPNNSTRSKEAWVQLYNACFDGDRFGPGPLACHNGWDCADFHLKLKSLILENAKYFHDQYMARHGREGDRAIFSECESLGRLIHLERAAALDKWDKQQAEKKQSKQSAALEKKRAEDYLGALPKSRGVRAPDGVELSTSDEEGLEALGTQTSSKNGKFYILSILSLHVLSEL